MGIRKIKYSKTEAVGKRLDMEGMRYHLEKHIDLGDYKLLKDLGEIILKKNWTIEGMKKDLGSDAIESLLDHVRNADHQSLEKGFNYLRANKIIK